MELLISLMMLASMMFFLMFFCDRKDVFSPRNILPLLYMIKLVPSMLYIAIYGVPDSINKEIVYNAISDKSVFVKYGLLQLISFIVMMVCINLVIENWEMNHLGLKEESLLRKKYDKNMSKRLKVWGVIFFAVSLSAVIVNIQSIGGLFFFLNNLHMRTTLLRNQDILVWISSFIIYAPLLFIYSKKYDDKKTIGLYMWLFIIFIGLINGMGGRKSILLLIINGIIIFNYAVKPIQIEKIFTVRNISILMIILFLFALLPMLRVQGQFEELINNPGELISSTIENVGMLVVNESYVPYYITTVDYFNHLNIWYGKSFKGLLTAFIPSSMYSGKPPVDDGMYLYSICRGRTDISPIMATSDLDVSSYPLETFGSMYANFGSFGVIIGMVLLGYIIAKVYLYMAKDDYSFFSILVYINILFNFELSTLRITQVLISLVLIFVITNISEKITL